MHDCLAETVLSDTRSQKNAARVAKVVASGYHGAVHAARGDDGDEGEDEASALGLWLASNCIELRIGAGGVDFFVHLR